MRSIVYFIKEALVNSRRNIGTAIGAIITIFLSLLIVGVFSITSLIINNVVNEVEQEVNISFYLSDNAANANVQAMEAQLRSNPLVSSVTYLSKDQALQKFKSMPGQDNQNFVNELSGNPLPASLEINLVDPENVQQVVDSIEQNPLFTKIAQEPTKPDNSLLYGQEIVPKLFAASNIIRVVSAILVLMMVIVALIFIYNTIRLAITARKTEIEIMRLVGASNRFIRGPFLMEGAIQALVAAVLAILAIQFLVDFGLPLISNMIPWLPVSIAGGTVTLVCFALLVVGLIIGVLGSWLAMRKHLRV
ncbi:MAG: permease-like cell division protein FtsX [Coriobacteriales bacterium]|jgi:cell division transport system permease protein|nr:permease-like cell division protein FtsX [Coriobacteriales bacterium]